METPESVTERIYKAILICQIEKKNQANWNKSENETALLSIWLRWNLPQSLHFPLANSGGKFSAAKDL